MDKLIIELCEILEIEVLPLGVRFDELPQWDSLNALSVIALLDANYAIHMGAEELLAFHTISDFVNYVSAGKS